MTKLCWIKDDLVLLVLYSEILTSRNWVDAIVSKSVNHGPKKKWDSTWHVKVQYKFRGTPLTLNYGLWYMTPISQLFVLDFSAILTDRFIVVLVWVLVLPNKYKYYKFFILLVPIINNIIMKISAVNKVHIIADWLTYLSLQHYQIYQQRTLKPSFQFLWNILYQPYQFWNNNNKIITANLLAYCSVTPTNGKLWLFWLLYVW